MFKIMRSLRTLSFVCFAMAFGVPVSAQTIKTVAGGTPNNGPLPALSVAFRPRTVALTPSGGYYIATGSQVLRVDNNGQLSAYAGTGIGVTGGPRGDGGAATAADFCDVNGIALDSSGNLFIADDCDYVIRRVDASTGIISTVAGNGTWGYSGDGAPATAAKLAGPAGVAVDGAGNLFIADEFNRRVRRVDAATQVITTVAGTGTRGFSGDGGPATSAELDEPQNITVDSAGNLFIADVGRSRIRRVDAATQVITTVAGSGGGGGSFGGDGGLATSAFLDEPVQVAVDGAGNLFIADELNNRVRRVDAATQVITTVAGNGTFGFSGDGGPATSAELDGPTGVAVDSAGNLFIADNFNLRIRRVDAGTQVINTVAGNGTFDFSGDGGPATSAQLNAPTGVAVDNTGNLFIADMRNARIRRVDAATQGITTVAGTGTVAYSQDGAPATSAELYAPYDSAVDPAGNLFIADGFPVGTAGDNRIRRVDAATQIMTTAAGKPGANDCSKCITFSGDGGAATSAQLYEPLGVALDGAGNLFIADTYNERIRRVDAATQVINTVAGNGGFSSGGDGGPATSAALSAPWHVVVDGAGNLFIADGRNNRVRRVDAATQVITTVAGNGTEGFSGDGGPATSAELAGPNGVAIDAAGNLFIADTDNNRIRRVDAATQVISTVAGAGGYGFSGDGGLATSAELAVPTRVAVDSAGNLFIADAGNNRIREVVMNSQGPQSQTITFAAMANRTFAPGDAFTVSATASSGLPVTLTVGPTDTCTISGMTVQITGAGSCTVTAHQDGNSSFNAAADVSHTFSIAKAPATINWGNLTTTYNGQPQSALVSTTPSGLAVSVTYNGALATPSSAGSYTVAAAVNDANYQATASGTLTIRPAPLTVTASSMTKILNAAMPAFAATYSGFVNGENASALNGTLNCTTTAPAASAVGSYPITCRGQSSANYAISYAPGTLRLLYAPAGQACDGAAGHTMLPPINANGTNVWNQGRTVPAKFRVCDANGVSIGTPGLVAGFYLIGTASGTSSTSMNDATPSTQFRWDAADQQWIFPIRTSGLAGGNTYACQILLNDGTAIVFQFGLR